jgi:hypothetical protein
MNKIYDKLLLAVAVLALLAGVGFYVMKSGEIPSAAPQLGQPGDNPYQVIPVPTSSEVTATWPEATETTKQPADELYDVFTPPEIYVDNDGTFIFKPPYDDTLPPPPFGIYLVEIEREPYRIQIEGYIEEDLGDASKSLVLLFDEEKQKQVRARIGQEKAKSEFTLVDFTIERVRDADGNISKIVIATLLDQRSGEEVVLKHGERLYTDTTTVVLGSKEDASVEVVLQEAPKAFETAAGKYVLEAINLEESSVTVKKLANDELELEEETQTLILSPLNEETTTSETTETEIEDDDDQAFDFSF